MNTFPQPKPTRSSARTIAKWQQHIAAQQTSGLRQSAGTAASTISAPNISACGSVGWQHWKRGSETAITETAKPELIPVIVKPETAATKSMPAILAITAPPKSFIVKAQLPNGLALESVWPAAQALSPLLTELVQLSC